MSTSRVMVDNLIIQLSTQINQLHETLRQIEDSGEVIVDCIEVHREEIASDSPYGMTTLIAGVEIKWRNKSQYLSEKVQDQYRRMERFHGIVDPLR